MPRTSAEIAMEAYAINRYARQHGREPGRVREVKDGERTLRLGEPGFTPLLLEGPLPPEHPLYDSPSEVRARRIAEQRRRRGL